MIRLQLHGMHVCFSRARYCFVFVSISLEVRDLFTKRSKVVVFNRHFYIYVTIKLLDTSVNYGVVTGCRRVNDSIFGLVACGAIVFK